MIERIKLIFYAILIGFFWSNFVLLLDYLSGTALFVGFAGYFGVSIFILALMANLLIYLLFIRKKKSVYALICIPSSCFFFVYCGEMVNRIFGENTIYAGGATILWYFSMFTSICTCVLLIVVYRLIIAIKNKRKKISKPIIVEKNQ